MRIVLTNSFIERVEFEILDRRGNLTDAEPRPAEAREMVEDAILQLQAWLSTQSRRSPMQLQLQVPTNAA